MRFVKLGLFLAAAAGLAPAALAQTTVGTTFTYQGRLDDNGQPANGLYDFQFQLAPAATGSFSGGSQNVDDVSVVNGLFTVKINFGAAFIGDARFIEVRVRPGISIGTYTPLAPRQELTPAPYAVGLSLPFSERQTNAASLFTLDQNGTGNCMTLTGSAGDCLDVSTDGAGEAIRAHTAGTGNAIGAYTSAAGANSVYAQTTGGGVPIYGYNLSTSGNAAFFRSENVGNASNCVEIQENGIGMGLHVSARTNRAGFFENTNAGNFGTVLMASNTGGGGPAIVGTTTGVNGAGIFTINNPASSHSALEATTNGTGPAGRFNGALEVNGATTANGPATVNGDATVNGTLKAEIGGVLNRATPVAWGRFTVNSNHNPTLLNSSGNVSVNWISGVGYRVHVGGESGSGSGWWVPVGTILYDGVAPEHVYTLRTNVPDSNGNVDFTWNCANCIIPNFDGDNIQITFVIYN